jgi:large subunit ribosomal protein L6
MAEVEMVRQSRLGKRPIPVPKGVKVAIANGTCDVQGPKGKLSIPLPQNVIIDQEGDEIRVLSDAAEQDAPRLQGLARALIASMVKGAAEGYTKTLELHGTGYRAELSGRKLTCLVGRSHPCVIELPASVSCEIPKDSKGTIINLSSADKAELGQVAATIKGFRLPEPYGGKGIRFKGEQIRRKAGKAGKGRK